MGYSLSFLTYLTFPKGVSLDFPFYGRVIPSYIDIRNTMEMYGSGSVPLKPTLINIEKEGLTYFLNITSHLSPPSNQIQHPDRADIRLGGIGVVFRDGLDIVS